jgi:hypothetical protein
MPRFLFVFVKVLLRYGDRLYLMGVSRAAAYFDSEDSSLSCVDRKWGTIVYSSNFGF